MREQKVQSAYNKHSRLYNKAVGGEARWARVFQRAVWGIDLADHDIEKSVLDCIPDDFNGRLLDVPVGTGMFTKHKYAVMKAADITCLDYSQGMLDRAAEAYATTGANVHLVQGDVANLVFDDGYFDAILTMNGLPCFPEKTRSMDEILRVLKSGSDLIGCSFVKGERILSNFVIGFIYTKIGYTTPPYQTAAELTAQLKPHFGSVRTWKMGALLGFECKGKTE